MPSRNYEGGKVITRVKGCDLAHLRLGIDFPFTRRLLSGRPTSGSSTVADLGFFSTCCLLLRPKPKMSRPEEDFRRAPAPTLPPDPRRCLCATTLSESTLLLPATAPDEPVAEASTWRGEKSEEKERKRIN